MPAGEPSAGEQVPSLPITLHAAHWAVQAEFWVGETLCCVAEQSGAYIDFAKAKPVPIPEKLRAQYAKALGIRR